MFAPACMPGEPGQPSAAIVAAEALIVSEEGDRCVNGTYYANEADARFWRRVEAERRVERDAKRTTGLTAENMTADLERWERAMKADEVLCPKCSGKCWDNRVTKRNPRAPDFVCRDRSCGGVIWPDNERRTA